MSKNNLRLPVDLTFKEWQVLRKFFDGEDVNHRMCGNALLKLVARRHDLRKRISKMLLSEHVCVVCKEVFVARKDALTCSDLCRRRKSNDI